MSGNSVMNSNSSAGGVGGGAGLAGVVGATLAEDLAGTAAATGDGAVATGLDGEAGCCGAGAGGLGRGVAPDMGGATGLVAAFGIPGAPGTAPGGIPDADGIGGIMPGALKGGCGIIPGGPGIIGIMPGGADIGGIPAIGICGKGA